VEVVVSMTQVLLPYLFSRPNALAVAADETDNNARAVFLMKLDDIITERKN
jgi:hypothetical protein